MSVHLDDKGIGQRNLVNGKWKFKQHPDADERMKSARTLVKMFLDATHLYPAHRKEFIRLALWKVTEAEGGKFRTRFRTRGSLVPGVKLQHEHVYERAKMADELIANPSRMHEILDLAVGCVVTKDEHARLSNISKLHPELTGWHRYVKAGISVVDTVSGEEITFSDG